MKKLFCLLLIAMVLCSLAACGRENSKGLLQPIQPITMHRSPLFHKDRPQKRNWSQSLKPLNQRKAQTVLMLTSQGLAVQWYIPKSII